MKSGNGFSFLPIRVWGSAWRFFGTPELGYNSLGVEGCSGEKIEFVLFSLDQEHKISNAANQEVSCTLSKHPVSAIIRKIFESLYGGQLTLSTQLMKPNYLVILPTDAAPQFR